MKIRFNENGSEYEAEAVREDIQYSDVSEDKVGIEIQMEESVDLHALADAIKDEQSLTLQILDNDGNVRKSYEGYRMRNAYKIYTNDTDSGLMEKSVVRINKVND